MGYQTRILPPEGDARASNIDSVKIKASNRYRFAPRGVYEFLPLLSKLRELELCSIRPMLWGAFTLERVCSLLDIVHKVGIPSLAYCKNTCHDSRVLPRTLVAQYTKLRTLMVAEQAVVVTCVSDPAIPNAPPRDFLPPMLENLIITHATAWSLPWLQELDRVDFAALRRVELQARRMLDLTNYDEYHTSLQHLLSMGIELVVQSMSSPPAGYIGIGARSKLDLPLYNNRGLAAFYNKNYLRDFVRGESCLVDVYLQNW